MKQYFQSFRLFFGGCQIKSITIFTAVIASFVILCGLTRLIPGSSFLIGFAQGVSTMMGAMCAAFGIMFLNSLYQYLSPLTPGYKYYASLPEGAKHFRRAVIVGNVLGIAVGLVLLTMIDIVFLLIDADFSMLFFGVSLLFLATGVCDLTGYLRNNTARIISMMSVLCLFGFSVGFFSGSEEEDAISAAQFYAEHSNIVFLIGGLSIAVFAAGLIYSIAAAEKKWGEAR